MAFFGANFEKSGLLNILTSGHTGHGPQDSQPEVLPKVQTRLFFQIWSFHRWDKKQGAIFYCLRSPNEKKWNFREINFYTLGRVLLQRFNFSAILIFLKTCTCQWQVFLFIFSKWDNPVLYSLHFSLFSSKQIFIKIANDKIWTRVFWSQGRLFCQVGDLLGSRLPKSIFTKIGCFGTS